MKCQRERGSSLIEFSLLTPWLIFLFVGALDWGFYAYSLIATEAAARVACLYASTSSTALADVNSSTGQCHLAIAQLTKMANVGTLAPPCASGTAVSATTPVGISSSSVTGPDGGSAAQVSVTYLTPVFIPMVLGNSTVLPKQVTITRTIQMRMRG